MLTTKSRLAVTVGIAFGILFWGVAWIPFSRWYPFVIPFIGGALATYLAGRDTTVKAREGVALGIKTGTIAATIFFVIGAPLTYLILRNMAESRWGKLGAAFPTSKFFLIMFVCAVVGLVLAVIGSTMAVPLFGRRTSQSA
jgi:hypothetical protein